jgi:hypothetical protein
MSLSTSFDNLTVVANAVQLSTEVIANVSGNLISNHLDGVPVTERTLSALAASEINNSIEGAKNA